MKIDLTVNVWSLMTGLVTVGMLLWRGGVWVGLLQALREAFDAHVIEDQHRFDRLEDRLPAKPHRS